MLDSKIKLLHYHETLGYEDIVWGFWGCGRWLAATSKVQW